MYPWCRIPVRNNKIELSALYQRKTEISIEAVKFRLHRCEKSPYVGMGRFLSALERAAFFKFRVFRKKMIFSVKTHVDYLKRKRM